MLALTLTQGESCSCDPLECQLESCTLRFASYGFSIVRLRTVSAASASSPYPPVWGQGQRGSCLLSQAADGTGGAGQPQSCWVHPCCPHWVCTGSPDHTRPPQTWHVCPLDTAMSSSIWRSSGARCLLHLQERPPCLFCSSLLTLVFRGSVWSSPRENVLQHRLVCAGDTEASLQCCHRKKYLLHSTHELSTACTSFKLLAVLVCCSGLLLAFRS